MKTGAEGLVADYLTPEQLWNKTFAFKTSGEKNFQPFRLKIKVVQKATPILSRNCCKNTLEAIANNQNEFY
jgi:type I restriction enzyme R subunit